ncbi:MAG: D-alanyl-D-alanine carboxypeptidase [Verrucomicrobia bacterium]|nr:D-alanyl-D-alanine carboxypeptidase [Verrucomicrobiota bacterium]
MIFERLRLSASLLCLCALAAVAQAAPAAAFKGEIITDATTGQVLFQDNPDEVSPPASVTKLMTFLVVYDAIKAGQITLDTPVTITAEETRIGGTQVWLKEKEVFTVDELLYALMIQSANDAAVALARTVAGSREGFVERMNARAQQLGLTRTTFHSPHGLPPSKGQKADLTTPRDLATLARELILNTDVLRYTSTKQRAFGGAQRAQQVLMINHNHLLGHVAGVDGLKTGFTNAAGFCLAATAERNGHRLIAVIMGSPDRKTRDLQMASLIEKGFTLLPATSVFKSHAPVATATATANPAAPAAGPLSPISGTAAEEPADDATAPLVKFTLPGKK